MRSTSDSHRIYKINENYFDNIDTEEKAYFLGFLYADGCNATNGYAIILNLKNELSERNLLYKFAKIIYKNDSEKHVHFYNAPSAKGDEGKIATLSIYSKYICKKLNDIGCTPVKSLNLFFSKMVRL